MVLFNRVVVTVLALLLLASSVITLLVTTGAVGAGILPYNWFEATLQRAADASGGTETTIIAVAAVIALLMIALLALQFTGMRGPATLIISDAGDGTVRVDRDSVRLLAETAATRVRLVREARCRVKRREPGVSISCRVSTVWGSDIQGTSAELRDRISQEVRQRAGLDVVQVDVETEYEKLQAKPVGGAGGS